MTTIKATALGLALLGLSLQTSYAAPVAPTSNPYARVCANGYVKTLEVSGVEGVGPGWYPWLIATIDQTGFQGGGTTTVNTYYTGDREGDKKWALILGAFQTAYLSRVPIVVYSASDDQPPCMDYPRAFTVKLCTSEADCNGVQSAQGAEGRSPRP